MTRYWQRILMQNVAYTHMHVLRNFHMPKRPISRNHEINYKMAFYDKMDRKIPKIYQECRTASETENHLE